MIRFIATPGRMFVPLGPKEVDLLRRDEEFQDLYIDSLALMQDLLCRHVGDHGRPRFLDRDAAIEALDESVGLASDAAGSRRLFQGIVEGMRENASRAKVLSEDADHPALYPRPYVLKEIEIFLKSLSSQFQIFTQ